MLKKILLVDDDADIKEMLKYNLEKENYEVITASNGQEGILKASEDKPDLILMDIMMPIIDGIEAGRRIKANPKLNHIHIIYLTARAEEFSEIAAFDAGADDYLTKPIKPRALMSRINAFFRKENSKLIDEDLIESNGLIINKKNYSVTLSNGSNIVLPKKEFELLFLLASHPDKVLTREELLQKIWGADVYVVERTVDVHIRKVREKVGDDCIKTLKGVGYMYPSKID